MHGYEACPLCRGARGRPLAAAPARRYRECPDCRLAWMEPADRLPPDAELAHYRTHDNRPDDPRYRRFLDQLWAPLRERLAAGARGLDHGSGPGPTLHLMARADGFDCAHYDPFFAPVAERLLRRYDFITCSETAEHFHDPATEFARLSGMLRPGGWLAVMTERLPQPGAFAGWYYLKDPTHVCFYAEDTFHWIARRHGFATPLFPGPRVALLQRPR